MNYKPFTFEKNYDERLKDFTEILNPTLKTSAIKATWSACVDLIVDPIGWQAIWKISRNLCLDLKIYFPCSVIVYVSISKTTSPIPMYFFIDFFLSLIYFDFYLF